MKFTLKPAIARCVATLFCAALAWPFSAVAQKSPPVKVLDRIVAVVNDEVITRNELDERVKLAFRQLRQQGTPAPARETLERQLLERMVTDRVQLQFAKETGLRVDDVELDRAIARIAQENKLTSQQLRQVLEKDGIPFAKFRDDIRNEIVITRLREREVDTKIVVTDGEIDNFLSLQHQGDANEEYNVSHILVVVPENASPEQIAARRTRADEAYAQLKGGADFRQVAVAFSEAPDALQGGAMGWRQSSRLPTLFTEALRTLKPGELSAILRSANGFHILKLNDKRSGGAPVIVQQTHARHILVKTNELVSESEARSRLLALKERLENKADFAALARAHSEDASATRGGDLGWLSPGDTVPEFERAMNALKPGEISGPVQTPFGWHLIQVIERRNEDLSKERQRLAARQTLRARKSDEAYQEWVRQLRDRAYIDLRTDDR
jgi:peptidyl-prolyl cis-trans isomerase SurA